MAGLAGQNFYNLLLLTIDLYMIGVIVCMMFSSPIIQDFHNYFPAQFKKKITQPDKYIIPLLRPVVLTSKFVVCRNYCIFVPSFTKCFSILTRESSRKMHKSWIDMTVDSTSFLFLANRKIIRSHTYNTPWNLIPHICYFRQVWRHNCRRLASQIQWFCNTQCAKKEKYSAITNLKKNT